MFRFYFSTIFLVLVQFLIQSPALAMQSFEAEYNTKVAGIKLGVVKHQMKCHSGLCELTNIAQPAKAIRWLVTESSVETIKLAPQKDYLKWLSHQINIERKKYNKTEQIQRNFYLDSQINKVISPEKNVEFKAQKYGYDMISIMYAMQFYMQNKQQIPNLYLQEDNKQTPVNFKIKYRKTKVNLGYQNKVDATYFEWETNNEAGYISAKVWLIDNLNYFPGKIEIYNQDDNRKLILNLRNKPVIKKI